METKKVIVLTSMIVTGVCTSISYVVGKECYKRGYNNGAKLILEINAINEKLKEKKKKSKKFWKRS